MNLLNQILRGVVIGVANIIPGVSGGTMMVSMGIYDTLIYCITHLFSDFKKCILTLIPYAIGMVVGIVALASVLEYLFEAYALPTSTAFIGLILGGLGPIFAKVDRKKMGASAILMFVLFFSLIVVMSLTGETTNPETLPLTMGNVIIMFLVGTVAAATMIVPGVSGSMVLMLLGYYTPVLNAVSTLKDAVFAFDFAAMVAPLGMLVPFGVGVVIGIFAVAKMIEWLLNRFPTQTYCAVLGLVVSSPIAILLRTDMTGTGLVSILVSLLTFALGYVGALMLSRQGAKNENA